MLKWMAKLLGDSAFELPPDVPAAWAQRLEKLLEPLDQVDGGKGRKGLARDILGFVLQGEPMAVLNEVGQRPEVGERFRLTGYHYGSGSRELPDVFEHFGALPPPIALRWARLLEASVKGQASSCRMQLPRGIHWPEVLLMASAETSVTGWSSERPKAHGLTCGQIEAMLQADGLDPSALLVACFATPVDSGYGAGQRLLMLTDLPDYPQALERHLEAVRPLLLAAAVGQRVHVLAMLARATAPLLEQFAPQLCELAVAGSKQVRIPAEGALRRCGALASAPLRDLAAHGKPEQRLHALRLLHQLGSERSDGADVTFARETALADKAPSVQALIAEWAVGQQAAEQEDETYEVVLPSIDWSAANCRVPPDALARLWKDIDESITRSNASTREHHARMAAQGHRFTLRQEELFT
ncbi:MAG: hypothetical protein LW768_17405, partial [Rubrivivax sp.]|nr:hypothetical protein [Rubrivivax sp.]